MSLFKRLFGTKDVAPAVEQAQTASTVTIPLHINIDDLKPLLCLDDEYPNDFFVDNAPDGKSGYAVFMVNKTTREVIGYFTLAGDQPKYVLDEYLILIRAAHGWNRFLDKMQIR